MKAQEIRELSPDERIQKVNDMKQELFNLRFQHEVGQLENPMRMKALKREIARMKTVIREEELNHSETKE